MKKIFIGSLVGGIIMFIWGFLAWTILPIHLHTINYSPALDTVLQVMANNNTETGVYYAPMADNRNITSFDSKYQEESQKIMEATKGQPAVTVSYLKEGYAMGGTTILHGFLINFCAVLAACIVLAPAFAHMNSFFGRWWLVLLIGAVVALCGPVLNYNWMATPGVYAKDIVVDVLVNWGITGIWLAWYFKNK